MQASETSGAASSNGSSSQDSLFECNICLNTVKDAVVSMCGHLFCRTCLHRWMEIKPNGKMCPVCKSAISISKIIPLYGRGDSNGDPRSPFFYQLQEKVHQLSLETIKEWESYSGTTIQVKSNQNKAFAGVSATRAALDRINKDIEVFKVLEAFSEVIGTDNKVMPVLKRTITTLSKRRLDLQVRLVIWLRTQSLLALKKSVGAVKNQVQCLHKKETTADLEAAFHVLKCDLQTMKKRDKVICIVLRNHSVLRNQPPNHIQEEDILKFQKVHEYIKEEEKALFSFFGELENKNQQNEHLSEELVEKFKNKIMEEREQKKRSNFHPDPPCKKRRVDDGSSSAISANSDANSHCDPSCSSVSHISTPGYSGYQAQEKNILQPLSNLVSDEQLCSNNFIDIAAAAVAAIQRTSEEISQDSSGNQASTEFAAQLASI